MKTFKEAFNEIMDAVIVYKQKKSDISVVSSFDISEDGRETWDIEVFLDEWSHCVFYGDDDIKFTELAESIIEASLVA